MISQPMLFIEHLNLTQFKNYSGSRFSFNKKITGICGSNGSGKTNILDAVYYCCFTKSRFSRNEINNIQFGKDGLRIEGDFIKTGKPEKVTAVYRGKKEFAVNGVNYERLAEHIGLFPCVLIAPDDIELVNGSSEIRRRYLDTLISQADKEYLYSLISYNKILQQRNSLLKQLGENKSSDYSLLHVLNEQLIKPGNYIYTVREKVCAELLTKAVSTYNSISSNTETIDISYTSQLQANSFYQLLAETQNKDLALQRTTAGIHRDDCEVKLNDAEFKTTASQGQKKSLLFALKLAEFEFLKRKKNVEPILLLDDVFEKLDEQRMHQLLYRVCKQNNGQVIITDTHCDRLKEAFEALDEKYSIIDLNGNNG